MCSSDLQEYLKPLLDHNPVFQLLDMLLDLELLAKLGQFCREAGIEEFPLAKLDCEFYQCVRMHINRDLETWGFCFSSQLEGVLIDLLVHRIAEESFSDNDSSTAFCNWFDEWYYDPIHPKASEVILNIDDYETFKQYVLKKFEEEREKWEEGSL